MAQRYGAAPEDWVAAFERNLVPCDDGRSHLRPGPELTEQMREAMESLDLIPCYRDTRCPLLLVLATEDLPEQQAFHELYVAYRRGIAEHLASLDNPSLRVLHFAGASHAMVAERPQELATLITDFLSREEVGSPIQSS